jgi:hypothetical protein
MGGKDLLNEILYKLQIKDKLVGNNAKINAIKTKVVHSPGYLIIIDEAEDVKIGIYKLIKEIIDFTYTKVGVVVSGMRLIDKIELLAYKGRQGFPQLKRRLFTNKARVQQIARTEIVDICAKHGIVNVSAHKWFENNVKDFQMLSEYIKDSLSIAKKDGLQVRSINGDFMNENFNLF